MFDIFKKDIKVGDKVKLYLTTGKEPVGIVSEIGDNFVLLKGDDSVSNRFFDKLIGGWDIISLYSDFSAINSNSSKGIIDGNTLKLDKELLLIKSNALLSSLDKSILDKILEPNGYITNVFNAKCVARNAKYDTITILKNRVIDSTLLQSLNEFKPGDLIPVFININTKKVENIYAYAVINPKSIREIINNMIEFANKEDYYKVSLSVSILRLFVQRNKDLGSIIGEIGKITYDKGFKKETDFRSQENALKDSLSKESDGTLENATINKLFELDINEHNYVSSDLIKNGNRPTISIANKLYHLAKDRRDVNTKEIYLQFLDSAKAFSELSFFNDEYIDSLTSYSMNKANYLYSLFQKKIQSGNTNFIELSKFKDPACTYYFEAISLLRTKNLDVLIIMLNNVLKLRVLYFATKNQTTIDSQRIFKGSFTDTITFLLQSKHSEIKDILIRSLVQFGVFNSSAFIQFSDSKYFSLIRNNLNIQDIHNYQENNESIEKDQTVLSNLMRRISTEKANRTKFKDKISALTLIPFTPINFIEINEHFSQVEIYDSILSESDREIRVSVKDILKDLMSYLNRNSTEKNTILLRTSTLIERQMRMIVENISYFGRTCFYDLLTKWKGEVDILIREKNSHKFPSLKVIIDPQYYLEVDKQYTAPLVIKNIGGATAEGFSLFFSITSPELEYVRELTYSTDKEISPQNQMDTIIVLPKDLFVRSKIAQLQIGIEPIYQSRKLPLKTFEFTLEKEPESSLSYEDIPWKDGPIPPEHLFKGRSGLISDLSQHYLSMDKGKPYILYGLTRTGKSSILEYLQNKLEGDHFLERKKEMDIITFKWNLQEIANSSTAREFYSDIINERIYPIMREKLEKCQKWGNGFSISERGQFKDIKLILEFLKQNNLYPIFFIDELSYITDLMDRHIIGPAFLAALREYSLNGLASFVFAGTYDIKKLINDPKYGITGQFVHSIDYQVDKINSDSARELINVINHQLSFTPEAIEHILHLSGNIPYFIQIICKSCGDYAVENKRRHIGYPELEKVVRILIGEEESKNSLVTRLTPGKFSNNQVSTTDPQEVSVLISSLAYFNKGNVTPRGVGFHELEKLWNDKKLTSHKSILAASIQSLLAKKILLQEEEEALPVYKFSVDLFRRWWYHHHQDLNLELTTLIVS